MTPEGEKIQIPEISKFVCGWKYDEDEQCSCENDSLVCTPDSAMEATCREILKGKSENGHWAYCHDWVDPQPFYQNCLTDLCNSNSKSTKCNAFAAYTRACMVTQPYSREYGCVTMQALVYAAKALHLVDFEFELHKSVKQF